MTLPAPLGTQLQPEEPGRIPVQPAGRGSREKGARSCPGGGRRWRSWGGPGPRGSTRRRLGWRVTPRASKGVDGAPSHRVGAPIGTGSWENTATSSAGAEAAIQPPQRRRLLTVAAGRLLPSGSPNSTGRWGRWRRSGGGIGPGLGEALRGGPHPSCTLGADRTGPRGINGLPREQRQGTQWRRRARGRRGTWRRSLDVLKGLSSSWTTTGTGGVPGHGDGDRARAPGRPSLRGVQDDDRRCVQSGQAGREGLPRVTWGDEAQHVANEQQHKSCSVLLQKAGAGTGPPSPSRDACVRPRNPEPGAVQGAVPADQGPGMKVSAVLGLCVTWRTGYQRRPRRGPQGGAQRGARVVFPRTPRGKRPTEERPRGSPHCRRRSNRGLRTREGSPHPAQFASGSGSCV